MKKNDCTVYGLNGVCRILDIVPSPFDPHDPRLYYVMKPLTGTENAMIYTPVAYGDSHFRPVMTQTEAMNVPALFRHVEIISVDNEKKRRDTYSRTLAEGTPLACIRILKTVAVRREEMAGQKKHLPDLDIKFEEKAKKCLYGELSVALQCTYEEAQNFFESETIKTVAK